LAVSGTITYRPTASTIITDALTQVGGIDPESGLGASATQTATALRMLNALVKTWGTRGLQLWERRYGVVFPQNGQGLFVLGSPGPAGDHACLTTPLNGGFIQTTLSADAASGATTISVTSVTGQLDTVGNPAVSITNAYNIGIELDDGTLQWTTVSGAPSGTTVTLAAALTDDAGEGNYVYCYQTKLIRPLRIVDAFVRQVAAGNDVPCRVMSREEYNRFGSKSSEGTPVQLYYDPQSNTGNLYIYPTFSSVQQLLFIQFEKPIDDFATTADDFDMPQEWAEALMWNLAWRLCPSYQTPKDTVKEIKELALFTYEQIDGWDQEVASMFLQPSTWPNMEGNK
jgi:hypothetical protein